MWQTDLNCGGRTCPPCTEGQLCAENSDCVSKVCNTEWAEAGEGFCARATCSDQKRNGDEVRPVDVLVRGTPCLVSVSTHGLADVVASGGRGLWRLALHRLQGRPEVWRWR